MGALLDTQLQISPMRISTLAIKLIPVPFFVFKLNQIDNQSY